MIYAYYVWFKVLLFRIKSDNYFHTVTEIFQVALEIIVRMEKVDKLEIEIVIYDARRFKHNASECFFATNK